MQEVVMAFVHQWLIRLLLVLDAAKHFTAVRLTCYGISCTIIHFASNEDTFLYQYVARYKKKLYLENVLLERFDKKVLEEYPAFIECVDIQDSIALKVISVPRNITCVRMYYTGLSKLVFEERSALLRLYIEKSQLASIPSTIGKTRSLKLLDITEANVRHVNLATFCDHSRLESIILKRNKIRYLLNSATRSCPLYEALIFLKLSDNRLKSLDLMMFSRFRRIYFFDFSHNRLVKVKTGPTMSQAMERFEIHTNRLKEFSFCQWLLPNVVWMKLSRNALTIVPSCLQNWTNITHLSLWENKLSTFSIESIANMHKLLTLDLSWNRIQFVRLGSAQFPKSLELLDLHGNLLHQLDLSFVPVQMLTINVKNNFIAGFDANSTTGNVSALELTRNPNDCSWTSEQLCVIGVPCMPEDVQW